MELILSGNPNLKTIENVAFFAKKQFGKIDRVFLIDTDETIEDKNKNPLIDKRTEILRKIFDPDVEISFRVFQKETLYAEIPLLLGNHIKNLGRENLIIDLTNGNKLITSILYASASLSKIVKLIYVFIAPEKQAEKPEGLKDGEFKVELISPVENIKSISNNTFFEIIYYLEESEKIAKELAVYTYSSSFLTNLLRSQVKNCIFSYFEEKYSEAVNTLGQVIEELSYEICLKLKAKSQGQIQQKKPNKNFDEIITWLRVNFSDPLRGKRNENLLPHEAQFKKLQTLDKIFDVIRVYRNLNTHPYDVLRGQTEARLILNNGIYALQNIIESGVLA